ncbi:SseB family protein [Streptomyces sp. NPDC093225]|uniref:SseB family protein n=1 Tax=Streptomyces sp. NPDC093225 TaxID=3366034 RepID=UPI00381AF0DE
MLTAEIAAMRAGAGRPQRLVGELRRATLLAPVVDGALMSGVQGGVRWLYAFTDEESLARFLLRRGADPAAGTEYLAVLGARLLDSVIPSLDGPTGIAVDVADEDGAMLFPPVAGIVPDSVALDTATA